MILVDMNQISLASLMMHLHMNKGELDEEMVRHMILNSVRMYRTMFNEKYGELILTYDSRAYWRKEIFPQYKANRKKNRESDGKDWNSIFAVLNQIKDEIKEFLPYKVVETYGAEADDVIAILCKHYQSEKIMIVSGDKDFIQLHNEYVKQYNPVLNKFVGKGENPSLYIKEHILKGDRSDGIPNVLSDDNVFIEGRRQRPLSKKKINSWVEEVFMTFTEEEQKNYNRNRKLIDLNCIPQELEDKINNEFLNVEVASRDKILNYFITKKLKTLIEVIDEF